MNGQRRRDGSGYGRQMWRVVESGIGEALYLFFSFFSLKNTTFKWGYINVCRQSETQTANQ
jgi:hypothetical protein